MRLVTYPRIGLNLVGQEDCQVELFGQLLQPGEELVEFLDVNFRRTGQTLDSPAVVPKALLAQNSLDLTVSHRGRKRTPDSRKRFMMLSTMSSLYVRSSTKLPVSAAAETRREADRKASSTKKSHCCSEDQARA